LGKQNNGVGNNLATVDLTGLSSFNVNGSLANTTVTVSSISGTNNFSSSVLMLPRTGAGTTTITAFNLTIVGGGTNGSGNEVNKVFLGSGVNSFFLTNLNVGVGGRDTGSITYDPTNTTGSVVIQGDAAGTLTTALNIGTGTAGTGIAGTNKVGFTGHAATLKFGAVNINTQPARTSNLISTFSFDQGSLSMGTLTMATKSGGSGRDFATLNLGGGTTTIASVAKIGARHISPSWRRAGRNQNTRGHRAPNRCRLRSGTPERG
jgi:hypothetical protein